MLGVGVVLLQQSRSRIQNLNRNAGEVGRLWGKDWGEDQWLKHSVSSANATASERHAVASFLPTKHSCTSSEVRRSSPDLGQKTGSIPIIIRTLSLYDTNSRLELFAPYYFVSYYTTPRPRPRLLPVSSPRSTSPRPPYSNRY